MRRRWWCCRRWVRWANAHLRDGRSQPALRRSYRRLGVGLGGFNGSVSLVHLLPKVLKLPLIAQHVDGVQLVLVEPLLELGDALSAVLGLGLGRLVLMLVSQ